MAVGDIKTQYRRNYICVNPDASLGPDTWRVASPQVTGIVNPGGGGTAYNFDGEPPIKIDITAGPVDQPSTVTTSMDIKQLDDRS